MITTPHTTDDCLNALLAMEYCCKMPDADPRNVQASFEIAWAACQIMGTDDAESALHRLAIKIALEGDMRGF